MSRAKPTSYRILIQSRLDRATFEWLERTAEENNVTVSAYIRAIVVDARNDTGTSQMVMAD